MMLCSTQEAHLLFFLAIVAPARFLDRGELEDVASEGAHENLGAVRGKADRPHLSEAGHRRRRHDVERSQGRQVDDGP